MKLYRRLSQRSKIILISNVLPPLLFFNKTFYLLLTYNQQHKGPELEIGKEGTPLLCYNVDKVPTGVPSLPNRRSARPIYRWEDLRYVKGGDYSVSAASIPLPLPEKVRAFGGFPICLLSLFRVCEQRASSHRLSPLGKPWHQGAGTAAKLPC